MYVCMYLCMYVYVRVYVCVCVCVCMIPDCAGAPRTLAPSLLWQVLSDDDVTYVYDDVTYVYDDMT